MDASSGKWPGPGREGGGAQVGQLANRPANSGHSHIQCPQVLHEEVGWAEFYDGNYNAHASGFNHNKQTEGHHNYFAKTKRSKAG